LQLATNGTTTALTLDASQNATFAGSVKTNTLTSATSTALTLQSAGTTAITVDTNQNVGVGVTPTAQYSGIKSLQVGSTTNLFDNGASSKFYHNAYTATSGDDKYLTTGYAQAYLMPSNGQHIWYTSASGTAGNNITFTQAMTLDASGNLLVGVTSGSQKLIVSNSAASVVGYFINSNATTAYGTQITYTGKAPNSTGEEFIYCNDTSVARFVARSNGGLANYSANNVNLSDRREKTNFSPSKSYLNVICSIPVQTFNYIDQNMEEDDGLTLGVVAQDVQAVAPELVSESNWASRDAPEKMRLSIYQTDLQYALMKSIQELKAELDELKAKVNA
jgi:hypothetical protein